MKFKPASIPGVLMVEPDVFRDKRGFFFESYHKEKYKKGGIDVEFVQDNHSKSARGTLRGLHGQTSYPQAKLVRVLQGEIFDVAVDVRNDSPTFKRWVGERLSASNQKQLFIPAGFAHGFCVLSETADVEYKCSDFYHPEDEFSLLWNDPDIGIEWPVSNPVLSKKDASAKTLAEMYRRVEGSRKADGST